MSYDPPVKLYYAANNESTSEDCRLVPAPQISISPEIYYANNIAIGYTFNVTLNGYATSLDLRNPAPSAIFSDTLESIQNIKNLFFVNNGTLLITNNGSEILKGTGGIVKSIQFEESDNQWINYAPYTIELELNELNIGSCGGAPSFACGNIPEGIVETPELVDMTKYKIKSFEDSWSITLDENIYSSHSGIDNQYFNLEYNVSAIGKHYFNGQNLLPAWEQAKNFCQDRLTKQINSLTDQCLDGETTEGCEGTTLSNAFITSDGNGILSEINLDSSYDIFNESASVEASEAEGSFKINYKSIIKKRGSAEKAIHTFIVTKKISDDENGKIISYNISGSIQGLIPGALIRKESHLKLPSYGTVIESTTFNGDSKYSNAYSYYISNVGDNKTLLVDFVRDKINNNDINITYAGLGISGCSDPTTAPDRCTSFSLTHDNIKGIISYEAEYDGSKILSLIDKIPIKTYSLSIEEPLPMTAEFIIPGRSGGPVIQLLDIETPRKYTLSVEGLETPNLCNTTNISSLVSGACNGDYAIDSVGIPNIDLGTVFLIEEKYKKGFNGTYTLNRTYIEYE
jgi:hypothetical protein